MDVSVKKSNERSGLTTAQAEAVWNCSTLICDAALKNFVFLSFISLHATHEM